MVQDAEIARLQSQVDAVSVESATPREKGFSGSKAEALLAFEYDRIPNIAKSPRAIALQRRVATAVLILVPILLVVVAVVGGINAYRDHQHSVEAQRAASKWGDDLRHDVEQSLKHSN
jgi:hypothetical protein